MNRRDFLATTAAAATWPSWTQAKEPPQKPQPIEIVDTHQHLWDLRKFKLAWQKEKPYSDLARNFLLDDYAKATRGINVVKTIYMEVDAPPEHHVTEAEFVTDLCRRRDNRLVAAVIGGRPAGDQFERYLARFKGNAYIKGVREILFENPERCLETSFLAGVRLLGKAGMRFDIELPTSGLVHGARLVKVCPDTRFILDHCGNPDLQSGDISKWKSGVEKIAEHKNVVVKISGLLSWVKKGAWGPDDLAPAVDHLWEVFGPDRVMFGSDWPVVTLKATYKQWVDALRQVVARRSASERQKLFHDNAVKFYGLS